MWIVACAATASLTCNPEPRDPDATDDLTLAKVTPSAVSDPEAWRLFDRSLASGYTPGGDPVAITLEHPAALAKIKVRGPAPYTLQLSTSDGSSLGFPSIDLSRVAPGWQTLTAVAPVTTTDMSIRLTRVPGAPSGAVPELELWTSTPLSEPAPIVASPATATLTAGDCMTFAIHLSADPSSWRRATLTYTAHGAFRPFVLERSINGSNAVGGAWLVPDDSDHAFTDAFDPSLLVLGTNSIHLCAPKAATVPVVVSQVQVVGEMDRGTSFTATDGSALFDGDAKTTAHVAAGAPVTIALDRLTAPDALRVTGDEITGDVDCVDRAGKATPIASHPAQGGLWLDGAAHACAALRLTLDEDATLADLAVVGSTAGEPVDWPHLAVTSTPEHFGALAWVSGYTAMPSPMTGAVRIDVDGARDENLSGDFGQLVRRTSNLDSAWSIPVHALFPSGATETRTVVLGVDSHATVPAHAATAAAAHAAAIADPQFGSLGATATVTVASGKGGVAKLGTRAGLTVPAGALRTGTKVTMTHVTGTALPPLDPGMINVTAPLGHAYELGPATLRLTKPLEIEVPFDPTLLPSGMTANDVRTFTYDVTTKHWKKHDRLAVDLGLHTIHSSMLQAGTTIAAVLATPKNPTPLSFNPTTLSGVAAASPAAGIDLIEPPGASQQGDARVGLPIRIPAGRGDFMPTLGINYSSSGDNGWLGVGWNLSVPRIEIDTRWGAPTYSFGQSYEPRYLLDGTELVATDDVDGPACTDHSAGQRFHPRVEGEFAHILRCGTDPTNYYWEVRDRRGVLFTYGSVTPGTAELVSTKPHGNCTGPCAPGIYQWYLASAVDVHGNTTTYRYTQDDITPVGGEPGRDLYLASIAYTSHPPLGAAYSIQIVLDDGTRQDAIISGRGGFKRQTRHLVRSVQVKFQTTVIREYVLSYSHGQFGKTTLTSIHEYGEGGCAAGSNAFTLPTCSGGFEHTFGYQSDTEGFDSPVAWTTTSDVQPPGAGVLGKGNSTTFTGGISLSPHGTNGNGLSIGGTYTRGTRGEVVGMYDMNGDGLVDEVVSDGGVAKVLYNQGGSFALGDPLMPAPPMGSETHSGWGVSATVGYQEDGFGVSATGGYQSQTTRANQLLGDIDGDGFLDFISRGQSGDTVLFSSRCGTTQCFAPGTFATADTIDPSQDQVLDDTWQEIKDRGIPGDALVQWTAPYSGTITVRGQYELQNPPTSDPVTLTLYQGDVAVPGGSWTMTANPVPTNTSLSVTAGDQIYLRETTDGASSSGLHDQVIPKSAADAMTFAYATVCADGKAPPCPPGDLVTISPALDPSRAAVFTFATTDLRVTAPTPMVLPATGTVEVHVNISKTATPTPPTVSMSPRKIHVCSQLYDQTATNFDLPCSVNEVAGTDKTLDGGVGALDYDETFPVTQHAMMVGLTQVVTTQSFYVLRIESEYSFDPDAVTVAKAGTAPLIRYTSVCDPSDPFSACTATTTGLDVAGLDPSSLVPFFAPLTPALPEGAVPLPIQVPTTLSLTMQTFTNPIGPTPITIAVRGSSSGFFGELGCSTASCVASSFPIIHPSAGEWLSCEVYANNMHLHTLPAGASVNLRGDDGSTHLCTFIYRDTLVSNPPLAVTPFKGSYRGFRAGFWNEKLTFAPTELLADYADPSNLSDARKLEMASSVISPVAVFQGLQSAAIFGRAWVGPGSDALVSEAGALDEGNLDGGAIAASVSLTSGQDLFNPYYLRLSATRSGYVDAATSLQGIPLGASLNASVGQSETKTTTDLVDMNGDGIVDSVASNDSHAGSLTATSTVAVAPLAGFLFNSGYFRRSRGFDYSISLGGDAALPVTTASGRAISEVGPLVTAGSSVGYSTSTGLGLGRSEQKRDLIDINGDGLPDVVERSGTTISVCYNLGGQFGACEPFGTVDTEMATTPIDDFQATENGYTLDSTSDALSHSTTATQDDSTTIDLLVLRYTRATHTTSVRTPRQLIDLNGDGLPDLVMKTGTGMGDVLVQYNLGNGFAPTAHWHEQGWGAAGLGPTFSSTFASLLGAGGAIVGPDVLSGTSSQSSHTYSGHATINIENLIDVGLAFDTTIATDTYELAVVDVDGDGRPDHVLRRDTASSSSVYVKHNELAGQANLLQTIHNPLGASITLAYDQTGNSVAMPHVRQVLSRVTVDDGVNYGAGSRAPSR
ncbi:MAG TPA: SpvB/TcaC N-terminal domain-containing protein [Kofleriaceae bacterium]|jgi:hypothetical protein